MTHLSESAKVLLSIDEAVGIQHKAYKGPKMNGLEI